MKTPIAALLLIATLQRAMARDIQPEWPQVKIDFVDALDPGSWRLFITALHDLNTPIPVTEHALEVFLLKGKGTLDPAQSKPLLRFEGDVPAKGYKGSIKPVQKAKVAQAVVIVLALHADIVPEVRDAMGKAVATLLKSLREDAKVAVLAYGDTLQVLWSPDGQQWEWQDLDEYERCLGRLRAEVSGKMSAAKFACGALIEGPANLEGRVRLPAAQGLFPRFFGIREAEQVFEEAQKRGHFVLGRKRAGPFLEPFAGGAIEAAARLAAVGSEQSALRMVIVLSDGRDGYLRATDLASEKIAQNRECTQAAQACAQARAKAGLQRNATTLDHEGASPECTKQVLSCTLPKVAQAMRRREEVVADYLSGLVPRLRAMNIRVHAIALPGSDEVGKKRLAALALKTGGTYREAENAGVLEKGVALALAAELQSQVVVTGAESLDPEQEYTALVVLSGEERIVSPPYLFKTGKRVFFFEKPVEKARRWVISKLGHTLGPPVFWVGLVVGTAVALFFVYLSGKGFVGLVKGFGKRKASPKIGPAKVPTLKRP